MNKVWVFLLLLWTVISQEHVEWEQDATEDKGFIFSWPSEYGRASQFLPPENLVLWTERPLANKEKVSGEVKSQPQQNPTAALLLVSVQSVHTHEIAAGRPATVHLIKQRLCALLPAGRWNHAGEIWWKLPYLGGCGWTYQAQRLPEPQNFRALWGSSDFLASTYVSQR